MTCTWTSTTRTWVIIYIVFHLWLSTDLDSHLLFQMTNKGLHWLLCSLNAMVISNGLLHMDSEIHLRARLLVQMLSPANGENAMLLLTTYTCSHSTYTKVRHACTPSLCRSILTFHASADHTGVDNSTGNYTCEWATCTHCSLPQTSRFALISHLQSHTNEIPFSCELPSSSTHPFFSKAVISKPLMP